MGEIKLGKEFEAIIQRQIDSGRYDNASDVIAASLALLEALGSGVDDASEELKNAINESLDDGSDDIPLDEAFDHIEKLYRQDIKARG